MQELTAQTVLDILEFIFHEDQDQVTLALQILKEEEEEEI
jgi:hypothetical protein